MSSPNVDHFFRFARERYRIFLSRAAGAPPPWTNDQVLREWYFCNIFREDDRTTIWFRDHVREPLREDPRVLLATVVFRWFNRIETGLRIVDLLWGDWDTEEARRRLSFQVPVVTGAYIIKTPDGMSKLDGVLWCIDQIRPDIDKIEAEIRGGTLQNAHEVLTCYPYLGDFMSYEVVTDLRHTYLLGHAKDVMTWACPGPGCVRGLGWVVRDDPRAYRRSKRDEDRMLGYMRELLLCSTLRQHWPSGWPKWEMREVEHTLCEYDKYRRAALGQPLKRRYR